MLILRHLLYRLRVVNLRKWYFIGLLSGVVLCYVSFHLSRLGDSQPYQGMWQIKALKRSILAQTEVSSPPPVHQQQMNQLNSHILQMLLKIEKRLKHLPIRGKKIVEVRGRSEDLMYYENVLFDQGYQLVYQHSNIDSFNISSTYFGRKDNLELPKKRSYPWLLLLCLVSADVPCLRNDEMVSLKEEQKVNLFPGLKNILSKRSAFCSAMAMAKQIPELRHDLISPLCFVLPQQFNQLVHVTQALGYSVKWTVKGSYHNKSKIPFPRIIDLFHGQQQLHRLSNQKVVVQQLYDDQFSVFNRTFSVRVYILITSIAPLRAYIHNEGFVFHRQGSKKGFSKISGNIWLLSELWSYLAKYNGGQNSVKIAISNLSHVVLKMLLILEAAMLTPFTIHDYKTCQNCFQLFGVDCVFNKSLHPVVLAVSNQLAPKKSTKYTKVKEMMRTLLDDTINLLFPPFYSVVDEVAKALQGVETDIGLLEWNCALSNDICFSQQDLEHIMQSRREALIESGFRQLYPSTDASRYQGLVDQLQRQFTNQQSLKMWLNYRQFHGHGRRIFIARIGRKKGPELQISITAAVNKTDRKFCSHLMDGFQNYFPFIHVKEDCHFDTLYYQLPATRHTTSDLHRLMINLERWYEGTSLNEYNTDIDISSANVPRKSFNTSAVLSKKRNKQMSNQVSRQEFKGYSNDDECTNDLSTAPFLSSIFSNPSMSLSPAFDPLVTEYSVQVPFEVMLLKVWATVYNCQSEARLDDRFGTSRPSNITLGVGENRISFIVVDISLTEPRAINRYIFNINRMSLTQGEEPFDSQNEHQVCSLKQECDMPLFYNEGCGIQKDLFHSLTWPQYLKENNRKPLCRRGNAQGRWVMPCNACSNRSTCYWKQAVWHPYQCRYQHIKTKQLQECLKNRKLLFIGDSTNRGMMHYLIERLNGSLREWDKTHDIRLYRNVNNGFTMVSFAYYPQFWIPTNVRPLFDKALYQLIQRSRPLENNSNTILIVGGVHWLATQHLYMLLRAVRVERLHGIKLVMKTLGAGFHQPVDSVHSLSVVDQHKLILHNQGLSEYAHHHNFEVIDTFNMTSARYKDFMQGKCACHFHRVVEIESQDKVHHKSLKRYHVEGTINAIYSEILISQLCSKHIKKS